MQTSAVTERDPSMATPAALAPDHFATIAIGAIQPSAVNPRKYFDPVYLDQLAASIRTHGILEPLVLRQIETDGGPRRFEIIAGECRYRAAQTAGLQHVPAMVKTLSDEEALEVRLIENIHRRGLTPLEEAVGYRALIDSNPTKHSAESIAARLGLSPKYVWDRMKLIDLVPAAKELLEQERISAGHAILIARQKPADQQRIIDPTSTCWRGENGFDFEEAGSKKPGEWDRLKPISVRELERWIAEHIRFDVTAQMAAAPLEFGDTHEAVQQRLAQPGRGKKVIRVTYEHFVKPDARDETERTYCVTSWKRADGKHGSKPCDHRVLGVVAVGAGYGSAFDVCIAREKCDVHWKAERLRREKAATPGRGTAKRESSQSAMARRQEQWKREQAKRDAEAAAWQKAMPALLAAVVAKLQKASVSALGAFVIEAVDNYGHAAGRRARPLLPAPKTAEDFLRHAALTAICTYVEGYRSGEFAKMVQPFGVHVGQILKAQQAEKPTNEAAKRKARKTR